MIDKLTCLFRMSMNERKSNFELLRIVCMLFIVGGHLIAVHGSEKTFANTDWLIDMSLRGFFSVAVNAFILISGYWGIKFNLEKLIKLEFQTLFYSVCFFIIMLVLGQYRFNPIYDFKFFLPNSCILYWFIPNYMVLCLLAPLLNKFVNSMNVVQFRRLLVFVFPILYIWPTFSFLLNTKQFISDSGYGIVNFTYIYLLGRYIRYHYNIDRSARFYFMSFIVVCSSLSIVQLLLSYLLGFEFTSFYSYNSIFMITGATMLFLAFARMNFSSSLINKLAALCLSVYLIHSHPLVFSGGGHFYKITSSSWH